MDFFDKLTKKATETYKGAAEKTGKIAKEAKLKMKINENKTKINNLYQEIGKKVYQKHTSSEDICIKKDLEEECSKIDILASEIEAYHKEILELSDVKTCIKCKEPMDKNAKFCPKCGEEQPEIKEEEAKEVEILEQENENIAEDTQNIEQNNDNVEVQNVEENTENVEDGKMEYTEGEKVQTEENKNESNENQ